jgi:Berberine and berberine like
MGVEEARAGSVTAADAEALHRFLGNEGQDRVQAAYGEAKLARLVALKDAYDPSNVFRMNQNIPPTGWSPAPGNDWRSRPGGLPAADA